MRKLFPLFYHLSEKEKRQLFKSKSCYFVFDTNALLDIYRLGRETADKVLMLLGKYKDRIIIPKHVAYEYHNHMLAIITEIHGKYKSFLDQYDEKVMLNSIASLLKVSEEPSLRRKVVKYLEPALKEMISDIRGEQEYIYSQFNTWELQNKLSDALGSLVLPGFTEEEILSLEKEGEERFSKNVPPGYIDTRDKKTNIYGDYIIWREILRFANEKQCSIIFIGRDMKEDWIQRLNGMTCGPRQELLNEFSENSPHGKFHIYSLDQFLEFANEDDKVLNESEITEVKELVAPSVVKKNEEVIIKSSVPVKEPFPNDDKSEAPIQKSFPESSQENPKAL